MCSLAFLLCSGGNHVASNPSPTRISSAMWELWLKFKAFESKVKLGGIYADKPGYHNAREHLSSHDYSVEEVANDREGSAKLASAIDLTLPAAEMRKYSKRLDDAMKAKDGRLYINGEPIVREYIGTLDSRTVRCYMLTGGKAQGVGADSGPDSGRDRSHLGHIHISFIRKFAASADAIGRILSILKGETIADWQKATGGKPSGPPASSGGGSALPVDGVLGPKTISRWQRVMGTPVDGKISPNSELVKAVQRFLNAHGANPKLAVDGKGIAQNGKVTHTIRALQRYLGTPTDGKLDKPSDCIKALQRRLNTNRF
ncbi:peptidoglycan-binding protein [Actinoplanes sp. NPDC049265]|uniref:peptidoglycan-binding domain-containing protein n=1 Tax=Actinoplanes sp. NPDC049265 TaxID=3363902 RepID=UPI00370FE94D